MNVRKIFVFIITAFAFAVHAQSSDTLTLNAVIGEYLQITANEEGGNALYEALEELAERKINVNECGFPDLMRVPFMNYATASKIISYRERKGKINSLNELSTIGLPPSVVKRIRFFLTTKENEKREAIKDFTGRIRARTIANDLNYKKISMRHVKTYARIIASYGGNFFFTAIAEKDAGELNVADYKSANLLYRPGGIIKKVIVGNYVLQFGQGLAVWSPYSFSKSSDIKTSVMKNSDFLLPYRSAEENKFFGGAASTFNYGNFTASVFYSDKFYDAGIRNGVFGAIQSDGVHVSEAEKKNEKTLRINAFGGRFSYGNNYLRFSFLYFNNVFSANYFPDELQTGYGKKQSLFSFALNSNYKRMSFAGEFAYDGKGNAQIYVLRIALTDRFSVFSSFRNYAYDYFSLWAQGFGEYGKTNNERGFFIGGILANKLGKFSGYYDIFQEIESGKNNVFPCGGYDLLINFSSRKILRTNSKINLRVKFESKGNYKTFNDSETEQIVRRKTLRLRATLNSEISKELKIKTQMDFTRFSETENSVGYSVSQTVIWQLPYIRFVAYVSFFRTEDYASRTYNYEYDLDGIFKNNALYGDGVRYYLLLKKQLFDLFSVQFKIAETLKHSVRYTDVDLPGANDFTFSLQVEYRR